jgi:enterobactin synthetase component F
MTRPDSDIAPTAKLGDLVMSDDTLPLSTAQRGMWVGQQLAPQGAVFNIAEAIELHGVIDADLLRQALRQVTDEMETLRVRIVQRGLMARQSVRDRFPDPIAILDFSDATDPRAAAERWMMAELSAPVDFDSSPVWVSAVLKLSEDHWLWYHRAHHIMLDGFSGGMVVQRVAELYTALRQGRAPAPAPFGPLSGLIEMEAAYCTSDRYAKDRAYWMERMADLPEPATLARRFRPQAGGLLRATALLPAAAATRLCERVKGMNVSLPQALIALVAAYYFRVTGAEDLVFGMPVTARVGGAMRRCAGMVANAVPIRLAMAEDDTFDALFAQTARAVREALRHQQYRYEDLRRDLGLLNQGKQIARLGINIEPFDYELTFDGVRATPHNLSNAHMEDLTVFVYDRSDGSGLRIDLDANPGLYDKAELDQHLRRLQRLIETVSLDPGARVGEVDILEPGERERVTVEWNDTADAAPATTIPELVAQQAARTPDAAAVSFDGRAPRTLTYREVDELSRRLAGRFAEQDIGAGDVVAVALPRSEMLPVALLGIMRAGAAYLPIALDGPADRTSMILADAAPVCVLTLRAHEPIFQAQNLTCLFLDEALAEPVYPPADQATDPSATAYVLHTSGSTGRPKGVEVSHANLANFVAGMRDLLRPEPGDRLLSVTTITFDIAGLELFLPLTVGAQVVIAGRETILDPLAMGRLIREQAITMLQATPSFWRMLLANPDAPLSSVHALVGGEALPGDLAARMLARARKVTNLYGPTETTVWSTAMDLSPDDIDPPPIGRPIRNTQAYVLDARMRPAPVGVAGALHIAGAGVAKGYLNQASLTDERFLADPFAADRGRLYRTGDLARWREDGVLEYLGRDDQQVKIRGHRIELGEIEVHLARCEGVAAAAVAAHPDPAGALTLVAYVAAAPGCAPTRDGLRRHLASRTPDYMIPSVFMMLDALPHTANGKLDRKALPAPHWARDAHLPQAAPRTQTERTLAAIWKQVLRREDIGIFDNFFELGGDSLTGTELFMGISEQFSREIPFASLFRASTIAGLAELLDEDRADDPLEILLPLKTEGSKLPLFCIHPVIGFGWSYAALIRHIDPDQPLYALQAPGLRLRADDPTAGAASVEDLARRYLAEIRRVQPHGPYHLLGWSFGGLVAHAIAAQLRAGREEVAFLALLDSYPFAPDSEPGTEHDEARQVELALAFLGLAPTASQPSTMTALADHLCVQYDLMSQPIVQAVVRTQSDIMERLGRVVRDNLVLARRYDPPKIDVDLLFCQATARTTDQLEGLLQYQPEAWRSRVRGLAVHDIACHHQDILSPGPAARIGAIMRDHRLAELGAPA